MQLERKVKHRSWKTYIHRQTCLDSFCRKLLCPRDSGTQENENKPVSAVTVVCYGNAGFRHNSQGYPVVLKSQVIRHRLVNVFKVPVITIDEYNTSQICSECWNAEDPVKLIGLGDSRDERHSRLLAENGRNKEATWLLGARKNYFVRRCTNCGIIWNRDVNAARNMISLGKLLVDGKPRPALLRTPLRDLSRPPVPSTSSHSRRTLADTMLPSDPGAIQGHGEITDGDW